MSTELRSPDQTVDAPVCTESCVNAELVDRLRPTAEQAGGKAALFKALADETRLKVVYALSQAELCVCDVAVLINGTKAAASYHLRLLHRMGLAEYRRQGKLVYYRLRDQRLGELIRAVLAEPRR